jgi:hypothetical protein
VLTPPWPLGPADPRSRTVQLGFLSRALQALAFGATTGLGRIVASHYRFALPLIHFMPEIANIIIRRLYF